VLSMIITTRRWRKTLFWHLWEENIIISTSTFDNVGFCCCYELHTILMYKVNCALLQPKL